MYRTLATLLVAGGMIAGCGGEKPAPAAPAPAAPPAAAELPQPDYEIPMRNFAPVKIGHYDVQPMFEEEIENGHYNIKVTGGAFNAVRVWVGPEDARGVMVVKTELENDYQHGHLEVPKPVPADMKLWIEIETPDGETLKGSTPLQEAK